MPALARGLCVVATVGALLAAPGVAWAACTDMDGTTLQVQECIYGMWNDNNTSNNSINTYLSGANSELDNIYSILDSIGGEIQSGTIAQRLTYAGSSNAAWSSFIYGRMADSLSGNLGERAMESAANTYTITQQLDVLNDTKLTYGGMSLAQIGDGHRVVANAMATVEAQDYAARNLDATKVAGIFNSVNTGGQVDVRLQAINTNTGDSANTLITIKNHVDGLEGHVDQVEGYIDGLEAQGAAIQSAIDTTNARLLASDGQSAAERILSIYNRLATIRDNADGVEGSLLDLVSRADTTNARLLASDGASAAERILSIYNRLGTIRDNADGVEGSLIDLVTVAVPQATMLADVDAFARLVATPEAAERALFQTWRGSMLTLGQEQSTPMAAGAAAQQTMTSLYAGYQPVAVPALQTQTAAQATMAAQLVGNANPVIAIPTTIAAVPTIAGGLIIPRATVVQGQVMPVQTAISVKLGAVTSGLESITTLTVGMTDTTCSSYTGFPLSIPFLGTTLTMTLFDGATVEATGYCSQFKPALSAMMNVAGCVWLVYTVLAAWRRSG